MSANDFRDGMAAGAKPFEEKFHEQDDAYHKAADEVKRGNEILEHVLNQHTDTLEDIERKKLYDLNTPFDIKELGTEEKEYILAALCTLAARQNTVNENQQAFFRSVKKYLDLKTDTQTAIDLTKVENFEDLKSQKAIMQVVMEFMFLENDTMNFSASEEDYLDCFSVNSKGRTVIEDNIAKIYTAAGSKGLAEKYGFVPLTEEAQGPTIELVSENLEDIFILNYS